MQFELATDGLECRWWGGRTSFAGTARWKACVYHGPSRREGMFRARFEQAYRPPRSVLLGGSELNRQFSRRAVQYVEAHCAHQEPDGYRDPDDRCHIVRERCNRVSQHPNRVHERHHRTREFHPPRNAGTQATLRPRCILRHYSVSVMLAYSTSVRPRTVDLERGSIVGQRHSTRSPGLLP